MVSTEAFSVPGVGLLVDGWLSMRGITIGESVGNSLSRSSVHARRAMAVSGAYVKIKIKINNNIIHKIKILTGVCGLDVRDMVLIEYVCSTEVLLAPSSMQHHQ